ncbi:MAG: helix-turn-helix domain-containing protein [Opitutaceae bacterium]|nr:helix-turn-helix domain-containing protein [Opitutaceae bacterium]
MSTSGDAHPTVDASPPGEPGQMVAGYFNLGVCFDTWRGAGTRDWFLTFTLSGQGRIGHVDGDLLVSTGDIVILRPGVRHDYGSEKLNKRWEFFWVHFIPPPDWMPWLNWPQAHPGVLRIRIKSEAARTELRRVCETMVQRGHVQTPHGEALAMNALAELVIRCDEERAAAHENQVDPRVEKVVNYCSQRLDQVLMLDDLARVGGLSPARFSRLFAHEMGLPPMRYLEQLRINRACRLLELTQAKVSSVATQVGFENPFYFTLRFKKLMGTSPAEHRRRFLERVKPKEAGKKL